MAGIRLAVSRRRSANRKTFDTPAGGPRLTFEILSRRSTWSELPAGSGHIVKCARACRAVGSEPQLRAFVSRSP